MVWWLAAPVTIWGLKKAYDKITEPTPKKTNSNRSNTTLANAKRKRSNTRRKLVVGLVSKKRAELVEKLNTNSEMAGNVEHISNGNYQSNFEALDAQVASLSSAIKCLGTSKIKLFEPHHPEPVFDPIGDVVNRLLGDAIKEYGHMAGINAYDQYDENTDPFVLKLKKVKA